MQQGSSTKNRSWNIGSLDPLEDDCEEAFLIDVRQDADESMEDADDDSDDLVVT